MADDIGGIRSEVTADTSPLFAALQQAAAEMRRWDQQYGKLTVQITAQMPTQQMMQQTHRNVTELLAKQGALQIPIQLVAPSQEDVRRTHQVTVQGITAAQAAQQTAAPGQQITRPAVVQSPVAAQGGKSDSMRLAEAQAIANSSGQPHQYQTASGAIARAYPNVARGGPVGGAGGFAVGGNPLGPTGGGPREFLGGPAGTNIPGLQEELGRLRAEVQQLRSGGPQFVGGGGRSPEDRFSGTRGGSDTTRHDEIYRDARRREMHDLRRQQGTYNPAPQWGRGAGRTHAQVGASLSGLGKEVYDAGMARHGDPKQALQEAMDVTADEPPLAALEEWKRTRRPRLSKDERNEMDRLEYEESPQAARDELRWGLVGSRQGGPTGGWQAAMAAAAGGAGGGGGGGRRRPPAAAPPPPEPERPERRPSSRVFPKDMSDEELRAALLAGGRGPSITPTGMPGRGELEVGGIIPERRRGGTPYRSGLDLSLISEEQYQRERNLIRGRSTQIAREAVFAPRAAEALGPGEGAHLAEVSGARTIYQGMSEQEKQFELNRLVGAGYPGEEEAAKARLAAGQPPPRGGRGAGARGGPTRIPRIGPEESARISAENPEIRSNEAFIRQAQELSEQARAGIQQRSLGTFITGLVAAEEGRPAAVINIREHDKALAELIKRNKEQKEVQSATEESLGRLGVAKRVAAGETKGLTAEQIKEAGSVEQAQKAYDGYLANLTKAETATKQARGATVEAAKALDQSAGAFRGLAAGFVGGLAGSLAYGIGITAVTAGVDLFTKATERGVGVLTGQIGVSQRVTDALSDQARAQHGLTSVAVAENFAQSGLSSSVADTIRPLIEQRTALEAGSKAFSEQVDLLKTFQNLSQQQGKGGIPGITAGTGGVLGSQLFAQPGIAQQLAGLTPSGQSREAGGAIGAVGGALGGAAIGATLGAGVFSIPGALAGGLIGGIGGFFGGREIGGALGGLPGLAAGAGPRTAPSNGTGIGQFGRFGTPVGPIPTRGPAEQAGALQPNNVIAYRLAIEQLNEAAERGVPGITEFGGAVARATGPNAQRDIERTAEVLETGLGLSHDAATDLERAGFAIQGIGATDFQSGIEQATEFFNAAGKGAAIPDSTEVLTRLREQIIPARIFGANAQTALQNRLVNVQAGIATAAAPPLPVGATIPGGVEALSPQARGLFAGAQQLQAMQVGRIDIARAEIAQLTAPLGRGFQQGALGAFDQLQGLGQQAQGLQSFIVQSQVGLQTAQFDEQIRLANLQVSDLASTLNTVLGTQHAITDSSYDNLGAYQGQLILLQRQSAQLQLNNAQLGLESEELNQQLATLQLQLQQRQVNFRVAMAGFTAPGVTSEERAANIEQAEKEARFAQRQLDIRKQILANSREILQNNRQQVGIQAEALPLQFKVQDITLQRDYVTARNALELLGRARQVTIDVAGAQEQLQRVNNEIGRVQNRLNNYVQKAAEFQSQLISDQQEFIATYSDSTRTLLRRAQEFLGGISTSYSDAINDYLTSVTNQINRSLRQLQGIYSETPPSYTGDRPPGGGGPQPTAGQQGWAGYVGRRTQFTVGEVAGEEVAILRNPRQMSMGGGGTQVVFNISINNPNVRSSGDMDILARTVADAVEQRLSRRTSLLGFRPAHA